MTFDDKGRWKSNFEPNLTQEMHSRLCGSKNVRICIILIILEPKCMEMSSFQRFTKYEAKCRGRVWGVDDILSIQKIIMICQMVFYSTFCHRNVIKMCVLRKRALLHDYHSKNRNLCQIWRNTVNFQHFHWVYQVCKRAFGQFLQQKYFS